MTIVIILDKLMFSFALIMHGINLHKATIYIVIVFIIVNITVSTIMIA